jgi:TolA-binding protein
MSYENQIKENEAVIAKILSSDVVQNYIKMNEQIDTAQQFINHVKYLQHINSQMKQVLGQQEQQRLRNQQVQAQQMEEDNPQVNPLYSPSNEDKFVLPSADSVARVQVKNPNITPKYRRSPEQLAKAHYAVNAPNVDDYGYYPGETRPQVQEDVEENVAQKMAEEAEDIGTEEDVPIDGIPEFDDDEPAKAKPKKK